MYVGDHSLPGLEDLSQSQSGVLTRAQLLDLGATHGRIDAMLDASRWTAMTPRVILLHNHEPTRKQWMWIGLKDALPFCALCSHTSLECGGFRGFAKEADPIHLVVPKGAKTTRFPMIQLHESRRFSPDDIRRYNAMPCTEIHRSAVDAGAWQPWPRFAVTMMASVVQQRVCIVPRLHRALDEVGQVQHRKLMRLALSDISGGAEALSEIDVAHMCRKFDLRPPSRQRKRRDRSGRIRYLDCEWDLHDGTTVVLEIDGSHHMAVVNWDADIKRQRKVVTRHRHLLRATAMEARLEQEELVADLIAMGVPTT